MQTVLFEMDDPVSRDSLRVERDGSRLLVRSVADGRERVVVLCHGRAEGLRLGRALLDAFDSPASAPVQEVRPWR